MRVAIIGSGVAGISTAWELASSGHEVVVFEQSGNVAEGASFGSAGLIAPHVMVGWPFGEPRWPSVGPLGMTASPSWWSGEGTRAWLRRLRACQKKADQAAPRMQAVLTLADTSGQVITDSLRATGLELESGHGVTVLLRTDADRQMAADTLSQLAEAGTKPIELDPATLKVREPGLNEDTPLVGGLWFANDGVINGRQWLKALKSAIQRLGGQFHLNTQVLGVGANGLVELATPVEGHTRYHFERVVVCAGHVSKHLLAPSGLRLPLLALNHCGISAPVRESLYAPVSAAVDVQQRISISRTGQRVKVTSGEGIWPGKDAKAVFNKLYQAVNDWFPGSIHLHGPQACVQTWQGTCDHTPDGLPIVGPTGLPNVWVNCGFGTRGWTLAPGAARLLSERMCRPRDDEGQSPFDPARFTA